MNDFNHKYKIGEPLSLLFIRSNNCKKKYNNKYIMSAHIPKIEVETENSSRPTVKIDNPIKIEGIDIERDDDSSSVSSGSTVAPDVSAKHKSSKSSKTSFRKEKKNSFDAENYQNFINNSKKKSKDSISDSDSESGDSSYSDSDDSGSVSSGYSDYSKSSVATSNATVKDPKVEKQDILLKLIALEKKGIELTKKYSMSSKLKDLKFELKLHTEAIEKDLSVKFQQKVLMAAVTGIEMANKKFDPVGAKLDGWGESVMDNLDDYDSIFEKLYEKYKTRSELPPELQLLVTLVGSAVMFHITKTIFSTAAAGNGSGFQNSEIMKNIAAAMASNTQTGPPVKDISGPSFNLSSMMKDDDTVSDSTVETSKEVTVNSKGKRAINI